MKEEEDGASGGNNSSNSSSNSSSNTSTNTYNYVKWSELRLSLRRLGLDDSEADQLFAMLEANGEMDPEKTNRADTRPTEPLPAPT